MDIYKPQQQFSSIAKLLAVLIDKGNLATQKLSQILGFNANTIDNLMMDCVMLGVAKKENGIISLISNDEKEIINILQSFFKNHVLYIQLQAQIKDGENYNFFFELFSTAYEHSRISKKTRMSYCSKMYNWFLRLDLIHEREGKFYISNIKENKVLLKGTENRHRRNRYNLAESNLFWGNC